MRPKFEVGEVVLLRSKKCPQLNGEYTVESLEHWNSVRNSMTGELYGAGFLYQLAGVKAPGADGWLESSLRKKHQPGEMSFDSLMASLSSPKLLTHQPEGVAPL